MAHPRCAGGALVASDLTNPDHGGLPVFSTLRTPRKNSPPPEGRQKDVRSQHFCVISVTLSCPPARHSSRVGQRLQVAFGAAAALAAISLSPGSAQAYVVTVDGVQYDVTTFTGSYNANTSKFATAANNGVMPWWNNSTMAEAFAGQVGSALGLVNVDGTLGPFFGYRNNDVGISNYRWVGSTSAVGLGSAGYIAQRTWAQATPVPAPLPLLGAALPLSFCHRLRSRSKRLRHGASRLA
jgi:hypothetical protein